MTSSLDVTPENFVRTVHMLYHDQDATRKKIPSEWLLNVQSSLYAWSLADQLIRMNENSEVTCLSAQILRHKIQHNFDELPVEHCKALCDSLLDHLSRIELTRNTTVRIQLAVATADLALQYVGWKKPVEDVVEKLKTSSEHMLTLLEFLTALPEEKSTNCSNELRVIDENLDKAQNYTRIYTNLIESILECLVDGRQLDLSDLSCLHLLLYPLEHTDYEVVQSTLYTWYHLGELIQTNNQFIIDKVKSYMDKLVDVLCTQCKLDPDHLAIPPETDEKSSKNNGTSNSDLIEFRYRVQCFIEDTIYITEFIFYLFQKDV
ncbi:unnamed protein product [Rotaria sordida]|uniref:Importin N-terminal domain-containing protein n=1 Tax=Rotaria sordida TaxID=392033 RepID=A0A815GVB9_9BILA|nr:unnamed protein product [Rotaria sordida]CAF1419150.1 unnamed protein product [Rotaria sordida]CAF4009897.1 unnamed protein product [Rotaria sordida]